MKKIPLTKGLVAIVDDSDFQLLSKYKWHAYKNGKYAAAHIGRIGEDGKRKQVTMHRFLLGLKEGDQKQVDHINGNGLDNRRCNLRLCNNQQNHFNMKKKSKGVCFVRGKWQANITLNGKTKYLGRRDSKVEAQKLYDDAATKLFGEFARTNL